MTINQRIDYFTSILMYKAINKSNPNYVPIIGLSMLKINAKSTQDQPQMETSYLGYLLGLDKDLSSTGEYMLGTVYLWTLKITA